MSGYRVAYTDLARSGYAALDANQRRAFDGDVAAMARDPYAWGDPIRGNRDRRSAALGGVITENESARASSP
ncbi:hypothetical protein ACFZBU_20915 [Embleya sp. NPDC008237]|uniref:hypothetical protein n=1 Tax=Embleya sp. NPDC008237 TaxID=3363978 RepID=UPI0036E573F5